MIKNGNYSHGWRKASRLRNTSVGAIATLKGAVLFSLISGQAYGQTDPWSNAAGHLSTAFTGPIAKGLSLVALVLGGIELGFGEGNSRRVVGGLVFGVGLAIGAAQFLAWITS